MTEQDSMSTTNEVIKKNIPHVPPRVDAEYYQAEVNDELGDLPYAHGEAVLLSSTSWYQSTRCVNSTDKKIKSKIDEFLLATRNIFESIRCKGENLWTRTMIEEISMESDANAIEFLASFNYDVDAALFQMFIDIGCGKEFVQSHRNTELIERYPSLSNFTETKDRLFRTSKTMLGAYEVSESKALSQGSGTYSHSSKVEPIMMLDDKSSKASHESSDVISRNYSNIYFPRKIEKDIENANVNSAVTVSKKTETDEVDSPETTATLVSTKPSRDIMGKDKNECKKRWQLLHKKASKLSPKSNQGVAQVSSKTDDRASIIEAQEILDEAAGLPMYMNGPGENFTESIRSVLNEVLVGVMATREWIAKVHDTLFSAKKEFKFTELKEILQEGREKPFSSPEEAKLKEFLKSAETLGRQARKVLADNGSNVDGNGDSGNGGEKYTLVYLNNLIQELSRLPFQIKEFKQLVTLFQKVTHITSDVEILHERCIICKYRKPKQGGTDALRIPLSEARALCEDALNCQIQIPLLDPLIEYIEQCEEWRKEVLCLATQEKGPAEGKGVSLRKDSTASSKPTSLKRIEALFLEGERAPFEFTKELDILRDKKAQAKVWLEKLKSSFSKTGGRSQSLRKGGGGDGAGGGEKIGLEEMKQILQEGEELFDDESTRTAQGRELNRAQSVVDVAEEWIQRVKELITESYDSDSNSSLEAMRTIQEMLAEADQMPVIMPEAQVLRMHLDVLEWATKARPMLMMPELEIHADASADSNSSTNTSAENPHPPPATTSTRLVIKRTQKPSLSSMQRLAREITKIRSSLPPSILEDFTMKPVREEIFCLECVNKTEEWMAKLKRQMSNNMIRKGVKLSALKALFEEGRAIPIHLDAEMRPVRLAIAAAEDWIHEVHPILSKIGIECDLTRSVNPDDTQRDKKELEEGGKVSAKESIQKGKKKTGARGKKDGDAVLEGAGAAGDDDDPKVEEADGLGAAVVIDEEPAVPDPVVKKDGDDRVTFLAANIAAEFDEIKAARTRLSEAEKWLSDVEEHSRKGGASSSSSSTASKKRRPVAILEALLVAGDQLGLDFDVEKQKLRDILDSTAKWNATAQEQILQILSTGLNAITDEYRSFIINNFQKLPYIPFLATPISLEEAKQLVVEDECLDFMDHLQEHLKHADPKNVAIDQDIASKEAELWSRVYEMRQQLIELRNEGEDLGIVVSSSVLINICISSFDWVEETRDVLMSKSMSPSGFPPVASRDWGDYTKQVLDSVVTDACSLVESPSSWMERFSPQYKDLPLLAQSLSYLEYFQDKTNSSMMMMMQESEARENDEEGDGGVGGTPGGDEKIRSKRKREAVNWNDRNTVKTKRRGGAADGGGDEGGIATTTSTTGDEGAATEKTKRGGREGVSKKRTKKSEENDDDDEGDEEAAPNSEEGGGFNLLNDRTGQFLSPFAKYCKKESLAFPPAVEAFLDLWVRLLGVVAKRVSEEVETWSHDVKSIIERSEAASPGSTAKQCQAELTRLMKWATGRNLFMKQRRLLMRELIKCDEWIKSCNSIRAREEGSLMEIDAFRLFVKRGERLLLDFPEVADMRAEWRRAKAWISKLQKTGIEKGLARTTDLQDLVEEAKTLYANVSDNIDAIQSATKTYCLCRQAFHGEMVGCDTCDEWYHFQCIGMTKIQAEKCDKFICLKCSLKTSFNNAATIAADATNRWMSNEDTTRSHDQKKQKITKKKDKDGRELVTLKRNSSVLEHFVSYRLKAEGAEAPAFFEDLPVFDDTGNPDVMFGTIDSEIKNQNLHELLSTVKRIRDEIAAMEKKISKYSSELDELNSNIELESSRKSAIIEWMKAMQKVLWPTSSADLESGRPLGPEHPKQDHRLGFDRFNKGDCHYVLLPDGMCTAADAAISLEIDKVEDVTTILDCFRWMSWCNISLHLIRVPPTTMALKKIIDVTKLLRMVDDRIIKVFVNILTRAGQWKTKARKILTSHQPKKLIDTSKLSSIVLEASTIPISCRMKDVLRTALETSKPVPGGVEEQPPAPAPASESQGASGTVTGGESKKRKLAEKPVATSSAFISVNAEPTNSSDEEPDGDDKFKGFFRTGITGFAVAQKPDNLWPVNFPFSPKPVPMNPCNDE